MVIFKKNKNKNCYNNRNDDGAYMEFGMLAKSDWLTDRLEASAAAAEGTWPHLKFLFLLYRYDFFLFILYLSLKLKWIKKWNADAFYLHFAQYDVTFVVGERERWCERFREEILLNKRSFEEFCEYK